MMITQEFAFFVILLFQSLMALWRQDARKSVFAEV